MSQLNYMMITASPEVAAFIEQHGVARIFLDQEVLGKAERQGHLNTHKAAHTLQEIAAIAKRSLWCGSIRSIPKHLTK